MSVSEFDNFRQIPFTCALANAKPRLRIKLKCPQRDLKPNRKKTYGWASDPFNSGQTPIPAGWEQESARGSDLPETVGIFKSCRVSPVLSDSWLSLTAQPLPNRVVHSPAGSALTWISQYTQR